MEFRDSLNPKHNKKRTELSKRLERLRQIIDDQLDKGVETCRKKGGLPKMAVPLSIA